MCEPGHGGMRPGIHYNAVSNIMIQAHARRAVTAAGRSPADGGDGKVTSLQNERGMKGEGTQASGRRGDQTHQRVLGDTSSLSRALSYFFFLPVGKQSGAADRWNDPTLQGEAGI